MKILPAAAGKTLQLTIRSDDATISAQNTCTLNVTLEWPPMTRSAPKLHIGTAYADKGPVFTNIDINRNTYMFTLPRKEWNDYTDDKFDCLVGDNDIFLHIQPSDKYYAEKTCVAIYADFNDDGKFDGVHEKIYLAKAEDLKEGRNNVVFVTMTVPADAAAEFDARVGTFAADGNPATEFADGYFIAPDAVNPAQLVDFRFVKR